MKIWTDPPAAADVEALIHRYFDLLRAGQLTEAAQLVDHASNRHVLTALWKGSVGVNAEADGTTWTLSLTDDHDHDHDQNHDLHLSWLRELTLGPFHWGHTGHDHVYVEIVHDSRIIEVSLGFWVKPVDTGWVLAGPSTLW
ncbi:hypothetical protein AB0O01_10520 [Streptomyces sp. NPDC093252]|uniref:hypothetical protein n=1 Tax=Streptomyces sp. NPDC093252 TaxID=3154980 RepID=UPI0034153C4F